MQDPIILKESGQTEQFNRRKIRRSLVNSGVKPVDAEYIIEHVIRTLTPPLTTRKIFRAAKKFLRRYDAVSTMKYSLKQAIYALGPSGYPFEKYIGKVLQRQGYEVKVGTLVKGACVTHEVDVLARRDNSCLVVECKFHQNRQTVSDVKTALYVHARFLDILNSGEHCPAGRSRLKGMIITNTRFTSEAAKYAKCVGIETLGWKHPDGNSLERTIESGKTYPVTILPSATKQIVHALVENDIVLASEVRDMDIEKMARLTGLRHDLLAHLKSQSAQISG